MPDRPKSRQSASKASFRNFPEGFWKYQDFPNKKPDISADRIYHAVGVTLSVWEGVEESLAHLYMRLCGDFDPRGPLHATFGMIESSGSRLKVVMNAAERCFAQLWLDTRIRWRFDQIRNDVEAASRLRNEIAHGIVTTARGIDLRPDQAIGFAGSFLEAPSYMTARNLGPNDDRYARSGAWATSSVYRYNSQEILEISEKFRKLNKVIVNCIFDVTKGADGLSNMARDIIEADAKDGDLQV